MRQIKRILIIYLIIIANTTIIKKDIYAGEVPTNIFPKSIGMKGKVSEGNINVRTAPGLFSNVIGFKSSADVMITGKYGDWYRIEEDDKEAWINSQYVSVQNSEYVPDIPMLGKQIVEYGKKFIGTPYVWGGTSLSSGVDCSGFTQGIYKEFDININRTSSMQVLNGRPVSKKELKEGDLIFFDTNGENNGRISHVGVYAGDGEFIHSNSSKGISISSLDNTYYKRNYVTSVRPSGI